jgi:hypothetical protein
MERLARRLRRPLSQVKECLRECLRDFWMVHSVERSFSKDLEATANRPESENVSQHCRSGDKLGEHRNRFQLPEIAFVPGIEEARL